MARPKCDVEFICDNICRGCERDDDHSECPATDNEFTKEERISALVAALEELGGGWRPIETSPKDGTAVLGFWRSTEEIHQIMPVCYDNDNGWYAIDFFSSSDGGPKVHPTHWMPLPPAPKE